MSLWESIGRDIAAATGVQAELEAQLRLWEELA